MAVDPCLGQVLQLHRRGRALQQPGPALDCTRCHFDGHLCQLDGRLGRRLLDGRRRRDGRLNPRGLRRVRRVRRGRRGSLHLLRRKFAHQLRRSERDGARRRPLDSRADGERGCGVGAHREGKGKTVLAGECAEP